MYGQALHDLVNAELMSVKETLIDFGITICELRLGEQSNSLEHNYLSNSILGVALFDP